MSLENWFNVMKLAEELKREGWTFGHQENGEYIPVLSLLLVDGITLVLTLEGGQMVEVSDLKHMSRHHSKRRGDIMIFTTKLQEQALSKEEGGGMAMKQAPFRPLGYLRHIAEHEAYLARYHADQERKKREQEERNRRYAEQEERNKARHAEALRIFGEKLNEVFAGRTLEIEKVSFEGGKTSMQSLTFHLKGGGEIHFQPQHGYDGEGTLAVTVEDEIGFDFDFAELSVRTIATKA